MAQHAPASQSDLLPTVTLLGEALTAGSSTKRSTWSTPLRRREAIAGLVFILPWVLSLLAFTTYPVLATFYLSFTQYTVINPPEWIGLQNYQTMLQQDPVFWLA